MFVGTTEISESGSVISGFQPGERTRWAQAQTELQYLRFLALPLMVPEPSTFPFILAFVPREANWLLSVTSRGGISVSVHTTSFILQI